MPPSPNGSDMKEKAFVSLSLRIILEEGYPFGGTLSLAITLVSASALHAGTSAIAKLAAETTL
ncbi:hypothetical protein A2U01_0110910 [Trifolium medium]|uniref:Uncharacterized protein n=1 Tax=Trifolium medium TaxID=97028 RepID=A0A392VRJ9_9FABA|nr:hypothetical protein [Trifolium medium]